MTKIPPPLMTDDEDEAHSRRCLTEGISDAVLLLQITASEEAVASDFERLDPAYLHYTWSLESVANASKYLANLLVVMERVRTCERCDGPIKSMRSDARFCSTACRVAAHRAGNGA